MLGIAAEPAEKPDARFLALHRNSVPIPVSQFLSLFDGSRPLSSAGVREHGVVRPGEGLRGLASPPFKF